MQAKLVESLLLLQKFADEHWPPRNEAPPMPDWMKSEEKPTNGDTVLHNSPKMNAASNSSADLEDVEDATASVATSATGAETTTGGGETDDEDLKAPGPAVPNGIMEVSIADNMTLAWEEDPQTKEPMHEAVHCTTEALALVLLHPARTNKATDATLDVLTVLLKHHYITGRAGGKNDREGVTQTTTSEETTNSKEDKTEPKVEKSLLHQLVEGITRCSESSVESIQTGVVRAMLAITTSPKTSLHEASMLMAIRATFHVYLITKSPDCKKAAKSALYDMMRSVFNRMEAYDAMLPTNESHAESAEESNGDGEKAKADFSSFSSQFHTDGYLLFRALCKLSSKALLGEDGNKTPGNTMMSFVSNQTVDPLALNSKILSLELLQMVLEYSGPAFCTGEKFIYAVQNYLCVSLLKNCMSTNTKVAYFSQKIFLNLVYKFKSHLKSEIEVFMSNIFLRVLESPNSSFEQKALVLEALRALCSDPVLLTQIFLNYDCDMDANNLYKDIVQNLTKLSAKSTAAPNANMTKKEVEQDFELSLAGIEVLVSILKAFLKALVLPGGEDEEEGDSAAARLRKSLQIDVGMAAKPKVAEKKEAKEEVISANDFKSPMKTAPGSEASKLVNAFETKRAQQQNFETGVIKFNLSLKSGLKYFIDNGFVVLDAKSIALFFLANKDKLEKTMIGEALGREPDASFVKEKGIDSEKGGPGFFFRILDHYVDAFDFGGMMFDDAIRQFQSGFRLPGEAQKIDRIMEKFAERFTRQNLDVFPTADTAFILAFSVIMLNTDLHNPSIKEEKKMTSDSFVRNNRGIADGKDLPEEVLTGIFHRVKLNPFSLKEDDEARAKIKEQENLDTSIFFEGPSIFGASAEDRKKEKFRKEREEMMAATEQFFKKRQGKNKAARASVAANAQINESIDPADIVKLMFDVTWGPLIATLSQVLECSHDERSIAVCLNGFVYAVRIAAHTDMNLARDTFVNSLGKFTFLGSIKEMRHKNIESIRTLLSIAIMDGEYLDGSWGPVLQCISQLARLRLFASGLDSDEAFLTEETGKSGRDSSDHDLADGQGLFRQPTKAEINRETEEGNSRAVVAAFNEVLIDKVFSSTVALSARSLAHFIEQLVEVSAMEISGNSKRGVWGVGSSTRRLDSSRKLSTTYGGDDGPRIFSLQKLVEVADFNMVVRPRIAWAQVWEIMANHFASIGCHDNSMVSIFAIDSLRQLSFKFLEKPERSEFSFQKIFLKPFLEIMQNSSTREDIRELILRCVDNMIRTMSHNLRSGWTIFFSVLTASANDPSERINTLGLAILQRLLDEHLHQLCRLHHDDEVEETEKVDDEERELTPLQKHNRDANVEDFVGLCRASLSFVQTDYSTSPLPIGLSMRALCHTACYADLIGENRVLPPVSGSQTTDADQAGYTYEGLEEQEALGMVLWRTLLDGLANGIKTTLPSNAGGVGCLVQRGSVLALRSILLRHGHRFSTAQWKAILTDTLLPAIQAAAESDGSPVVSITSESPSISSVDFIVDPQALPPAHDDEGLRKFAEQASNAESAPTRPLGEAELLVEASFADMRHGGNGNLSRAFELAKKDMHYVPCEQPFPDSWVATTSAIALGTLTDIITEIALKRGSEGRALLWPLVLGQFQTWAVGCSDRQGDAWTPCEALVRVACREFHRLPLQLKGYLPNLPLDEHGAWAATVFSSIASTMSQIVDVETGIKEELIRTKFEAYGLAALNGEAFHDQEEPEEEEVGEVSAEVIMYTPYGKGRLVERRKELFECPSGEYETFVMNAIKLDFGGTLYRPAPGTNKTHKTRPEEKSSRPATPTSPHSNGLVPKSRKQATRESWWKNLVPAMKVRCVGVYCLEHYLYDLLDSYIPYVRQEDVNGLLEALNQSKILSAEASAQEDLSHAFQEAMLSQWGDGVEQVEEVLSNTGRMSHHHGSEMFFLTQEAGAMNDIIHMLSILYRFEGAGEVQWDREAFAETLLLERIKEVLHKFVESEKRDGHLIDPNVWRNASESGGKLAIYCTSFAGVVVNILHVMLAMNPEKFSKHIGEFFPALCSLVCVQSDEIRLLVKNVLEKKIAPKLNVPIE